MRWIYLVLGMVVLMSLFGRLSHYVPGQEDNPSLAKASLCGAAESMHKAMIKRATETGLIVESGVSESGAYTLVVSDAQWAEEPVESKELLAISGWCQVAGEDGRAVALVIGNSGKDDLASVIEGEFSESESQF